MSAVTFVSGQTAAKAHSSLRRSLQAMESARQCAVLWFAEVMRRRLFEELGYSSINQYAQEGLGFSKTRTGDFIRLARQLDNLPAVREALTSGELGYTKAREIVGVATPATQHEWLEAARKPRKELVREVKRVKRAARVDPAQANLLPDTPTLVTPKEIPVRFQIDLTPEQEARRAALVERIHKLGGAPNDKAELMLEALATLVESKGKPPPGGPRRLSPRADPRPRKGGAIDRSDRFRRTPTGPGRCRTPEMRCRRLRAGWPQQNHHSPTRPAGGPRP